MLVVRPIDFVLDRPAVERFLNRTDVPSARVFGERKHLALGTGEHGLLALAQGEVVGILQTAGNGLSAEIAAGDSSSAQRLLAEYVDGAGQRLSVWSKDGLWDVILSEAGFAVERVLFHMTADLPLEFEVDSRLSFTGFKPGDELKWLDLNNDAFRGHPEQGNWTLSDFEARMDMAWWDPAGLRLGWEGSELVASCWTKTTPQGVGEIYVIGVAESHQGRGLGYAMTHEGLRYLWEDRRCAQSSLYVDEANARAVMAYETMGFAVTSADRSYRLAPSS
jgi:mycothiol synthase